MTILDPATVRFCVALARQTAADMPKPRAPYNVAAGALEAFADELDALLKAGEKPKAGAQ